ncbi:MAG: ribosome assembly RNA-binding protein YhbY [Deltaproteobacteria bacterium]|nr:ribosome assembly RNA-binding protein YhbY [Deltaproteobacteria bacterium]
MPKKPVRRPARSAAPTRKKAASKKTSTRPAARSKTRATSAAAPAKKVSAKKEAAPILTGQQRAHLRGLGHHLDPVVQIGHKGVSAEVLKELDHTLVAHELLKVKLLKSAPLTVAEAAQQLAKAAGASLVQTIGKVIVLYRPSPDPDRRKVLLPKPKASAVDDEEPTEDLERMSDEE